MRSGGWRLAQDDEAEFTVATFNIGYCDLDKDADFFMDGGTMSRAAQYAINS